MLLLHLRIVDKALNAGVSDVFYHCHIVSQEFIFYRATTEAGNGQLGELACFSNA